MAQAQDPAVGRVIAGKYRVDARLSTGGMGALYRATQLFGQTELGQVVIKFLLAEYVFDADRRERFVREARAAREVRSPHVVRVFDFGEDEGGVPYLVMELLEGRSLFQVLAQQGPLSVPRVVRIGMQVAEAMVECHQRGVLHRDLKPDNLLLIDARAGDFVKIVDFGIARLGPAGAAVPSLAIGTPRYMAPEQLSGLPTDARSDIFALAVILFEALSGQAPIALRTGEDEMSYVSRNLSDTPRHPSALIAGVPRALDELLVRMMAKEPAERPASMAEVLTALEQIDGQLHSQEFAPRPREAPATLSVGQAAAVPRLIVTLLVASVLVLSGLVLFLLLRWAPAPTLRGLYVPSDIPATEPPPTGQR